MERAKRSLLLHAIDPRIGGTLLMGHRGCAKSTLARGFAKLLPNPAPFVEVPLGVSEDRLLGSVQADTLIHAGQWIPQPGLLEAAHGGVLYLDEINLLPDALADLLLDSAASGVHRLEREGLSRAVRSRYILVGTMNPEEGELRPQLSDRFAHSVQIEDRFSAIERVEIGRRRLAFEDDPEGFLEQYSATETELLLQVQHARKNLLQVEVPDALRLSLAERAHAAGLEGMRAELAILRTARAAAALQKAACVSAQNLEEAWDLCVGHRLNPDSPERPHTPPPQPPKQRTPQPPSAPDAPLSPTHRFDLLQAPTQAPSTTHAPMHASSSSTQPPTPFDARASAISLRAPVKPKIVAFPEPATSRHLTAHLRGARALTARLETSRLQPGPIRWQASLLASLRNGWRPSSPGWRWAQACVRPLRRLWVLLDASRSTGSAQFLASARDQVTSQLRAPLKVNLLVVHQSKVLWQARKVSPKRATQALESLPNAQGKSPITQAISTLRRALCAAAPTVMDKVLICSDGFPSLTPGETSSRAGARLRSALQRLTRNLPAPALWLSPQPQRGMDRWLGRMLQGTRILHCRLPQEQSPGFPAR